MMLTICLKTKGRERYLDEILTSIEKALKYSCVRYLIVDNGTPDHVSTKLNSWHNTHSYFGELIRFNINDPRDSTLWVELRKREIDWVVFPSDDDIFCPEIIPEWEFEANRNLNLVGYAASAIVIDEFSKESTQILTPTLLDLDLKVHQMASSLHQPPFLWPCLFLRVSKLPTSLPSSRFAFDWFISLHLLISGVVQSTTSIGLKYRVHNQQESFQAPLRRKYFEAQLCALEFVASNEFRQWVEDLSEVEKINFWKLLTRDLPIYGDPIFSNPVLSSIFRVILSSSNSSRTISRITSDLAIINGVFLKESEIQRLVTNASQRLVTNASLDQEQNLSNIKVLLGIRVCNELVDASRLLQGYSGSEEFVLSCEHSSWKKTGVKIACSKFVSENPESNADLIIFAITNYAERHNKISFTLTSGERFIIYTLRIARKVLPMYFLRYLQSKKKTF